MIRLASIRDIRGINELLLQVQKVHLDIRPDLFKYIGTKYNDSELEGIIKNSETPVFVYESDNKVVGYVFCIVTNYHNDTSFATIKLFILMICVLMKMQGMKELELHYTSMFWNMQKVSDVIMSH